jgi:hypothetical protein
VIDHTNQRVHATFDVPWDEPQVGADGLSPWISASRDPAWAVWEVARRLSHAPHENILVAVISMAPSPARGGSGEIVLDPTAPLLDCRRRNIGTATQGRMTNNEKEAVEKALFAVTTSSEVLFYGRIFAERVLSVLEFTPEVSSRVMMNSRSTSPSSSRRTGSQRRARGSSRSSGTRTTSRTTGATPVTASVLRTWLPAPSSPQPPRARLTAGAERYPPPIPARTEAEVLAITPPHPVASRPPRRAPRPSLHRAPYPPARGSETPLRASPTASSSTLSPNRHTACLAVYPTTGGAGLRRSNPPGSQTSQQSKSQ